jgi:hypothetical protein
MPTAGDGTFSFTIGTKDLARGLRPSKSSPRNEKFLVKSAGAIGLDNVLQSLKDLNIDRLDFTGITTLTFPYPQLFQLSCTMLVCTIDNIYELVGTTWTNVISLLAPQAGDPWTVVEFYNYIYMSNGVVSIVKHPEDLTWKLVTDLPTFSGICNYNGQVMICAPDSTIITTPTPTIGPWAFWKMEEDTSENRLDSSGNNHTLVLTDEGSGQTVPRITGYLNYAAQFYGYAYLKCTTGLTVPWVDVPFRVTFYEQMVWGTATSGEIRLYITSQRAAGEPPDPGLTIILSLPWDEDSYADTITVEVLLNNYNLHVTFTIPTDFNWHYFNVYSTRGTNLTIEVDDVVMYQNDSCVLGLILSETFTIVGHGSLVDPADISVGVDEVYIWA